MDTQALQAFCAVADQQSFSEAARRLFLTQPAVSKRIANLEQQLKCQLFDRIGRTVQLTEAGHLLLPRARQILQSIADSQRLIDDLSGEVRGTLHIATSHHIGLYRLPPLLKSFTGQYPNVELKLRFMDSERAYHEILHGTHDLAVVTLDPSDKHQIFRETWWQDELVFACANDHPLSTTKIRSLTELSRYPAILPDSNTHTTQLIQRLFDDINIPLTIGMTTQALDTIKMMVSIGLGWSVLPKTLIDDSLTILQPSLGGKTPTIHRDLGCIQHPSRTLSNAAQAFLTLSRSQITPNQP